MYDFVACSFYLHNFNAKYSKTLDFYFPAGNYTKTTGQFRMRTSAIQETKEKNKSGYLHSMMINSVTSDSIIH